MNALPCASTSLNLELRLFDPTRGGSEGQAGGPLSFYPRKGSPYLLLDVTTPDGRRVKRSSKTTDPVEARRAEARLLLSLGVAPVFEIPTTTSSEMVRIFLDHQGKLYPRSMRYFGIMCGHFLKQVGKERDISAITHQELAQLQASSREKNSAVSANRLLQVVRRMFNFAVESGLMTKNPAAAIKRLREPQRQRRFLNQGQQDRLLTECSEEFRSVVFVALRTGLRQEELVRLKPSHLDFNHDLINVVGTKSDKNRQVPMMPEVKALLLKLADFDGDTGLFKSKTGRPYTTRGIQSAFIRTRERAKLPDADFHDLRHSFASDCLKAGISISVIQLLLGHASVETTQIYAKLTGAYVQGTFPALEAYLAAQFRLRENEASAGQLELEGLIEKAGGKVLAQSE